MEQNEILEETRRTNELLRGQLLWMRAAAALLAGDGKDMFITLKESDVITKQTARLLGFAINRAFHGELSVEEMEELLA